MPKPSTNPTKVAQALVDLQQRVARGQEFPDAQWAAASGHDVDPDALADAYDAADYLAERARTAGIAQQERTNTATFARKPHTSADLDDHTSISRYTIVERREMSTAEYDAFASDFYAAREWLAGKGGTTDTGTHKVIAVHAPERTTLLVNPEGYDYAKYVARLG